MLTAEHLSKHYAFKKNIFGGQKIQKAVHDVSFHVQKGETLGVVGESGCGKTTLGRMIARLIKPTSGTVTFEGKNIQNLSSRELFEFRRSVQIVFQDPYASLNPRKTIYQTLIEGPKLHKLVKTKADRKDLVQKLLAQVGLAPQMYDRYPHEFSGGQRQRIAIARALSVSPSLIVADEPLSALDVSVQAQIANLLNDLQSQMGLTYLFISHDLRMVEYLSGMVIVMYFGQIMEIIPAKDLSGRSQHPYTKALLSSIPMVGKEPLILHGEVPNPFNPLKGCAFQTRCPFVEDRCKKESPMIKNLSNNHQAACHLL